MLDEFQYDVFLSHSSKDKGVVRALAERLRGDGVRVWFDEWEIRAGDSILAKIEEGLEHSRVLVLCMSQNAFGSDWTQLESQTFRFRDPLNKARRLIPLRLDQSPIKGSLAQFRYINWLAEDSEKEYAKLLEASRPLISVKSSPELGQSVRRPTVWVLGSYSELDSLEIQLTRKLIQKLGSALAARGARLVSGKSDMLDDLAANCRNVAMALTPRGPLPVILDGKLRETDLKALFMDTIGGLPNLAIVIGGSVRRGRTLQECEAAAEAGIPVLPVPVTGGTAAKVSLTAHHASDLYEGLKHDRSGINANDILDNLLEAIDRYAPDLPQGLTKGRPR